MMKCDNKYGDMDENELMEFIRDAKMRLYRNHTSDDISGGSYILSVCEDIVQAAEQLGVIRMYKEMEGGAG
jgi:hypothetical protein